MDSLYDPESYASARRVILAGGGSWSARLIENNPSPFAEFGQRKQRLKQPGPRHGCRNSPTSLQRFFV